MKNLFSKIECGGSTAKHLLAEFQCGVLAPGETEHHEESAQDSSGYAYHSHGDELRVEGHAGGGHRQGFAIARQAAEYHDAGNQSGHGQGNEDENGQGGEKKLRYNREWHSAVHHQICELEHFV